MFCLEIAVYLILCQCFKLWMLCGLKNLRLCTDRNMKISDIECLSIPYTQKYFSASALIFPYLFAI